MPEDLELDEEQRAAVEAADRAVAVLAGPGSGKTRVLSYRARHLLVSESGSKALLLTFTNKAAAEMKARALGVATVSSDRIHSQTYHSFCMRVLRAHGSHVGIAPDFEIMDVDEQQDFAASAARGAGVHNHSRAWSRQRIRGLLPPKPVAEFGAAYEAAKRKEQLVDFDDLIVYTAQLFQRRPEIAQAYGARYRHLLIDEFQDTNASQFAVVRALSEHTSTVSVFADDDQAIFHFAGAEAENIRRFCDDLQATEYPLTINYRCRDAIVQHANRLMLADSTASGREMRAAKAGGEVRLVRFGTIEEEARTLTRELEQLVATDMAASDIAVLVRSGYRAQVLLQSLGRSGLPVTNWLSQPGDTAGRRALRASLSVVRPALTDRGVVELRRLYGFGQTEVRETRAFLREFEGEPGAEELLAVHRTALEGGPVVAVLEKVKACLDSVPPDLAAPAAAILESVEAFRAHDPDFSLDQVLAELALVGSAGPPAEVGGIKIASLHRTKGLQWPIVYLLGLEDGHMPDHRSTDEEDLREERRLCFVGMCRAEDQLTLTHVRQSSGYDRPLSPFLHEMGLPA